MPMPLVISVILNTNRRDDTLACLRSLQQSTYANHRIIVLDNHSVDGSVEAIHGAFPDVDIVGLTDNRGYAGNNNVGIAAAMEHGAEWVFVLNEDTIIDAQCLARLLDVGQSNDEIGIVGPMVYHYDEPDIIQSAGGELGSHWESIHIAKNEADHGQFIHPHRVDWISGCAMLVRRAVIQQVGMLDERFFYYWEETEWCVRAGKAGWRIMQVPAAKIWHKGVQRDYRPKPAVVYYDTRNRFLLMAKHRAPLMAWLYVWTQTLKTLVSWSVRPKWRAMHDYRDAMWYGLVDFLQQRWGQMPSRSKAD